MKRGLPNNGMKLTARGASDEARQLIPVFDRPHQASEVVRVEPLYGLSGEVHWDRKKS